MKLSGTRNQCSGCGAFFNSNTAFDKHRTGKYGVNRRCRTPEEMQKLGMFINIYGYWVSEPMRNKFYGTAHTV